MVSGTSFPGGDPFLQRQNEPSIAVSSRNRLHLLGGANDYRTVDLPGLPVNEPTGDAWLGLFKSFDNGETWFSDLIPGYPQDQTPDGIASPLKGYSAAADPTVRAGTNGLLFYSGIVFNRNVSGQNKVFVARYVDDNNLETGDPIRYLGITFPGTSASSDFLDKPAMAVDIPRSGSPMCNVPAPPRSDANKDALIQFRGGAVYVAFTKFIGGPNSLNAQILLTHSADCGMTWATPVLVSTGQTTSQGASLAIDPTSGALYVTWRRFHNGLQGDAIMAVISSDGGQTFSQPGVIADITIPSFDLNDNQYAFRSNGYPSMVLDGAGHAYIAWSERTPYGARIRVASSKNSSHWNAPVWADNSPAPGHQFMPALTFTGGKLTLIYYDQRETATVGVYTAQTGGLFTETRTQVSGVDPTLFFDYYLQDALFVSGTPHPLPLRQTVEIRAAQADTAVPLQFANSIRVSNYEFGTPNTGADAATAQDVVQLQFNPPNLPMFSHGTTPFMGDYIDVGSQNFLANANGTWSYNLSDSSASAHAVWTDNRDVVAPLDRDWTHYTPVNSAQNTGTSKFDGSTVPACVVGQGGSRNQNIYTSRISPTGLIVGSRGNAKQLGYIPGTNTLLQRAYPVTVENLTDSQRNYQLSITQQPSGGQASFLQFSPLTTLNITVLPHATASRTVFATSTSAQASIVVTVLETGATGTPASGSVVLNPDATNPNISNPNISNPNISNPTISNAEVYNPNISNPNISNPNISNPSLLNYTLSNPNISNPNISNPNISNTVIANPNISNPNISNTNISNPNISNPNISNPNISNQGLSNTSLSDTSWPITNYGNTAAAYSLSFGSNGGLPIGAVAQLIVARPYKTPVATGNGATAGCDLAEETHYSVVLNLPNVPVSNNTTDPRITNQDTPTVTLGPGETALIIIRIYNPSPNAPVDASTIFTPVAIAQGANTGTTTPPTNVLQVLNSTVPNGTTGAPYAVQMQASGGTPPYQWFSFGGGLQALTITSFGLPGGVTLDQNTGLLSGTPTQSGSFFVTISVNDGIQNSAFRSYTLNIAPGPLVITTTSLPNGFQYYYAQVDVAGGSGNFTFAITGGALPKGFTLDAASGIISGYTSATGTFKFTVQVTDNVTLKTVKANYSINIAFGGG